MLTPAQSAAARALLGWKQQTLAAASGVGLSTIQRFEAGKSAPIAANMAALRSAFEHSGIRFIGLTGVDRAQVIAPATIQRLG